MLHDVLWRSNLELVQSCLAHPFTQALGDGTLKADLFRAFIAQDRIAPDDPVRYDFALTRLGIRDDTDLPAFLARCGVK